MKMEKSNIEVLKARVPCAVVLDQAGFAIDLKGSTRRALKYRRGDDIVIVIHEGKGWFDPRSDAKGDVFSLVGHLESVPFTEVLRRIAGLVGVVPREPAWTGPVRQRVPIAGVGDLVLSA
jgi:hypothetical protein